MIINKGKIIAAIVIAALLVLTYSHSKPQNSPEEIVATVSPSFISVNNDNGINNTVTVNEDGSFSVTLSVRCDILVGNLNFEGEQELIPSDGVIFPVTEVTAYEGESVFNVLQREMKRAKIHLEFRNTPIYDSSYILAINNIYEFEAGELSGWMYQVNGWYPNYGCSLYLLSPGDVIEWNYTCDLGQDLGEDWVEEN